MPRRRSRRGALRQCCKHDGSHESDRGNFLDRGRSKRLLSQEFANDALRTVQRRLSGRRSLRWRTGIAPRAPLRMGRGNAGRNVAIRIIVNTVVVKQAGSGRRQAVNDGQYKTNPAILPVQPIHVSSNLQLVHYTRTRRSRQGFLSLVYGARASRNATLLSCPLVFLNSVARIEDQFVTVERKLKRSPDAWAFWIAVDEAVHIGDMVRDDIELFDSRCFLAVYCRHLEPSRLRDSITLKLDPLRVARLTHHCVRAGLNQFPPPEKRFLQLFDPFLFQCRLRIPFTMSQVALNAENQRQSKEARQNT